MVLDLVLDALIPFLGSGQLEGHDEYVEAKVGGELPGGWDPGA